MTKDEQIAALRTALELVCHAAKELLDVAASHIPLPDSGHYAEIIQDARATLAAAPARPQGGRQLHHDFGCRVLTGAYNEEDCDCSARFAMDSALAAAPAQPQGGWDALSAALRERAAAYRARHDRIGHMVADELLAILAADNAPDARRGKP